MEVEISDWQWLMGSKQGRRVARRVLEMCGEHQTSWTGEALSMAFKEGMRNVGLTLMNIFTQHCPKGLIDMQREHLQREHLKHERSSDRTSPGTGSE
jgi:hypothetical protein